jgi:hypothetical protein
VAIRWQKVRRVSLRLFLAALGAVLLLWIGIHVFPSLGPWLADTARAVLGPGVVAKLEDFAYGVEDDVNRVRYKDAPPTELWAEPALDAEAPPAHAEELPAYFPPPAAVPTYKAVAAEHDGHWIFVADDAEPKGAPVLAKTQLHPDPKRPHAVVAVVAMDLGRVRLEMVPGTREPESTVTTVRPGKVPESDHAGLVAAFNGGWQAIHGHYGMMVDGITYLPPRENSCTIGIAKDTGGVRIGTWRLLETERAGFRAFRQTPQCLWESGTMNRELSDGTRNWGAAVGGDTVIRRSAIGLDAERRVLFFGMGDNLTAKTLGEAMVMAGASDVAELDVNWTFPRFLLYGHDGPAPQVAATLLPVAPYKVGEYVQSGWYRDFFYVTKRPVALDGGATSPEGGAP